MAGSGAAVPCSASKKKALAAAAAEGLMLVPAANASGFKGVTPNRAHSTARVSMKAKVPEKRRDQSLGFFETAEEAAQILYEKGLWYEPADAESPEYEPLELLLCHCVGCGVALGAGYLQSRLERSVGPRSRLVTSVRCSLMVYFTTSHAHDATTNCSAAALSRLHQEQALPAPEDLKARRAC